MRIYNVPLRLSPTFKKFAKLVVTNVSTGVTVRLKRKCLKEYSHLPGTSWHNSMFSVVLIEQRSRLTVHEIFDNTRTLEVYCWNMLRKIEAARRYWCNHIAQGANGASQFKNIAMIYCSRWKFMNVKIVNIATPYNCLRYSSR